MKKFTKVGSALTAALMIAGAITTSAFAASVPGADVGSYSYNTGKQSAVSRSNTFEGMSEEENMEKEYIEAWFESNGLGEGAAWSDGQYDESSKSSYGYSIGQAAYQQRHASFANDN